MVSVTWQACNCTVAIRQDVGEQPFKLLVCITSTETREHVVLRAHTRSYPSSMFSQLRLSTTLKTDKLNGGRGGESPEGKKHTRDNFSPQRRTWQHKRYIKLQQKSLWYAKTEPFQMTVPDSISLCEKQRSQILAGITFHWIETQPRWLHHENHLHRGTVQ